MKRFAIFALVLAMFLTACEGVWYVAIDRIEPDEPTITSTALPTETGTSLPSPTPTSTSTVTPTNTPQATNTAQPTPTREIANLITLTERVNLRSQPLVGVNTFVRVGEIGEQFSIISRCNGWLYDGNVYLFDNSDWYTGNVVVDCPTASNSSRVGYNTLEVFDVTYYHNHLLAICPEYTLIMDNLTLAVETYELLNPVCGTKIIHRDWHPSDGNEHLVRSPQEFVGKWVSQGHPEIIRYTTNEVSCYDNCEGYVAHEVEIARLARQAGYTVALGNTGVGKYSPQSVLRGVFNPLVQAANDYGHILGFHEYTGVCLCFGFGQMATEWLNDAARVQPEQWSSNVSYSLVPFSAQSALDYTPFGQEMLNEALFGEFVAQAAGCEGDLPSYWHMGRSFWILLHYECSTGNANTADIVHTEWGWDRLDDIRHVVNPLQEQYADPAFNYDFRGWQSYNRLWTNVYWTDWTIAQSAYNQIVHTTSLYPDNHYFLLFAWTDSCTRDWYLAGFGFGNCSTDGDAQEFHRLMESQ